MEKDTTNGTQSKCPPANVEKMHSKETEDKIEDRQMLINCLS